MRLKFLSVAMGLTALASLSVAQMTHAANLSEIHQMALENDAEYAAAKQAYLAGIEALPQGKALLRPTVSLTAAAYRNHLDPTPGASSDYNNHTYSLRLTQPLYRKQNLEEYEQSKLATLFAEQQFSLATQELALRVARGYFDVLLAQDNLAAAEAQKQALYEQLAQARKSFEVGAATIVDAHEAQARYDVARSQEIAALNDLEVRRSALEKIIGRPVPTLDEVLPGKPMDLPVPNEIAAWVKQAAENSLAVHSAQTALESAQREVGKQKGGHHPTLDLVASYTGRGATNSSATSPDSKAGVLGLEFNLPLYQGGATSSLVRQALANQEKARHDLETARRDSVQAARESFLGVVSGDAQVQALEAALISSQSQLKSTKLGLEVGVRTRVDLINAQQQLDSTQRGIASARYQTLLAGLQLKAAAGTLSVEDLKALDAWLKKP